MYLLLAAALITDIAEIHVHRKDVYGYVGTFPAGFPFKHGGKVIRPVNGCGPGADGKYAATLDAGQRVPILVGQRTVMPVTCGRKHGGVFFGMRISDPTRPVLIRLVGGLNAADQIQTGGGRFRFRIEHSAAVHIHPAVLGGNGSAHLCISLVARRIHGHGEVFVQSANTTPGNRLPGIRIPVVVARTVVRADTLVIITIVKDSGIAQERLQPISGISIPKGILKILTRAVITRHPADLIHAEPHIGQPAVSVRGVIVGGELPEMHVHAHPLPGTHAVYASLLVAVPVGTEELVDRLAYGGFTQGRHDTLWAYRYGPPVQKEIVNAFKRTVVLRIGKTLGTFRHGRTRACRTEIHLVK